MPPKRFLQVDVFSKRPGCGNPLAVVLDAEGSDAGIGTAGNRVFGNAIGGAESPHDQLVI